MTVTLLSMILNLPFISSTAVPSTDGTKLPSAAIVSQPVQCKNPSGDIPFSLLRLRCGNSSGNDDSHNIGNRFSAKRVDVGFEIDPGRAALRPAYPGFQRVYPARRWYDFSNPPRRSMQTILAVESVLCLVSRIRPND